MITSPLTVSRLAPGQVLEDATAIRADARLGRRQAMLVRDASSAQRVIARTSRARSVAICRDVDAARRRPGAGWASLAALPLPVARTTSRGRRRAPEVSQPRDDAQVVRQAAARSRAYSSALPVIAERVVHDRKGTAWQVREVDASHTPGARARRCLIFESQDVVRRCWQVPPDWLGLPTEELLALTRGCR